MRHYLLVFLLSLGTWGSLQAAETAPIKAKADSAYADRLYAQAVELYTEVLAETPSSMVYYNLGNAQFRLRQYPQAVLAYERALWLDPSNEDARFNLELVRTRLSDRFSQPKGMFFVTWLSGLISSRSATDWSFWAFVSLLLGGLFVGIYRADLPLILRKLGFAASLVALFAFLFDLVAAGYQTMAYRHNARAVVMVEQVQTYSSPTTSSKRTMLLHEGTTVEVLNKSDEQWLQVALPDGTEVWALAKQFTPVVIEKNKP